MTLVVRLRHVKILTASYSTIEEDTSQLKSVFDVCEFYFPVFFTMIFRNFVSVLLITDSFIESK